MIPAPVYPPPKKPRPALAAYRKAFIAAGGLALAFGAAFFPDNKYVIAAIAVATAFGVYRVPNKTKPPT